MLYARIAIAFRKHQNPNNRMKGGLLMDDSLYKSSCQIQRIGEIIRLGEQVAVILINGKRIELPIAKVAEGVGLGDQVVWTGENWAVYRNHHS